MYAALHASQQELRLNQNAGPRAFSTQASMLSLCKLCNITDELRRYAVPHQLLDTASMANAAV